MIPTPIAAVSYDYAGAAQATGFSVDVIRRAVKAGDLPVFYPRINGVPIAKPAIDADDLRAWVRAGATERQAS